MENLKAIAETFGGCIGVILITWLIVHFNGKTIIGTIDLFSALVSKIKPNRQLDHSFKKWLPIATEREVIILGLVPIAIASLVGTDGGICHNSIATLLITEAILIALFCLNFRQANWKSNFFGEFFFRKNAAVFILAIVWCLVFSVWGFLILDTAANYDIDRLLINGNADMWLYTRRFAAYTLNNLNFDNQSACSYLQISPKKLSSFIGSVIFYFSPRTALGITLFQGLLGCSLFLSLFGNWHNFIYNDKTLSLQATFLAILWGLTSPMIFWLIISSYASNILFMAVFALSLISARNICLNSKSYPRYVEVIMLFSFVVCIFAFYIVLLPIALFFYLATLIIYQYERYLTPISGIQTFAKLMLAAGLSILLCVMFFDHQIGLNEVVGNLNITVEHGKNFVPLNPWSLLQEKLKPMPNIKDFGVWFNIIIGIMASCFALKIIYRHLLNSNSQNQEPNFDNKDLIYAILVILAYVFYLLAYIPLDFTYRLGKLVTSIIYPLAILGFLPVIINYLDRYKSRAFKFICFGLAVLHIILHLDQMSLDAKPMGKYQIISAENINNIASLTLIKCQKPDSSQQYQKIVGLDLAKQYPNLKINVLTAEKAIANYPKTDLVLPGKDVQGRDDHLCVFTIDI